MNRIFAVLSLLLCGCSTSIYKVVNEKNFDFENNKPVLRKLVLVSENRFAESDYLVKVINKQNWNALDAYQHKYNVSENNTMLRPLKSLIEGRYDECIQYLNILPDSSFNSQTLILKTDCLQKMNVDSVDYYACYQYVFDTSGNSFIKKIAQKRYRFYKYGY